MRITLVLVGRDMTFAGLVHGPALARADLAQATAHEVPHHARA